MEEVEKIPVYIRIEKGRTVCVCHRGRKGCSRKCEADTVTRDKFDGWRSIMERDRYGKSKI